MARPSFQIPFDTDPDPSNPKLNVSCLDFLLIELVPLAQRITDQLHARDQALLAEIQKSKIFNNNNNNNNSSTPETTTAQTAPGLTVPGSGDRSHARDTGSGEKEGATVKTSVAGGTSILGGTTHLDASETREAVFWRLDNLGYRVGQGLVERFSVNKPRPTTALEAIKFICKDLWILLFRKQIDNLKTNHRGVFVLMDSRFQPISRMSVDRRAGAKGAEEALRKAQSVRKIQLSEKTERRNADLDVAGQYLYFPCGVIRGALAGLGVDVTITAETTEIPAATFQIKTKGAKA